jgi:hypothetical protein
MSATESVASSQLCIYCRTNPAGSNEHIFGTWLITDLTAVLGRAPGHGWIGSEENRREIHGREGRANRYSFDFTTDTVCHRCNNGWMNNVDIKARRTVHSLMRGDRTLLTGKARARVAAWAAKTAVTARFAHVEPDYVSELWTNELFNSHKAPRDWLVWLAHYRGNEGLKYLAEDVRVTAPNSPTDVLIPHGVLMTMVLGQLCVQILGFENTFALTESDITTALQIWPASPRRCNWPLNGFVDDSNLDVYARRLLGPS